MVHELHKSLSSNFGFYGESKFDQLNSSIPYFGIIKILDEYFEAVLKQEKNISINLKEKLIAKLGDDAFVLTSKIKNLENLIGKQEVATKLSTKEEEERFYRVFIVLMEIITDDNKPLLFFVDDLQWADVGTIDLIKLIVQTKTIKNLLIVNAYRDNEVNNNHIYMMMLNSLKETTYIDEFTLKNLSKDDVSELVTDLIHTKDTTLIDFFYDMSLGNAFFINQMINLFNSENLFIFDTENLKFEYDIKKLKAIGLSKDVVEIATKNISLLDDDIIEVLKVASVVGNRFDIELAKSILSETLNIGELLEKAQEKSFIIKIKKQYKFSHDRIQQAFYTLIDEKELPNLHKNIALKLDKNQDKIEFFENIKLEMAIHYNHALDILCEDEKIKVVALNLEMAKLLKEALAYDEALMYLENGLSIIDKTDEELYWEYLFLKIEIYFNTSQIDKIDDIVLLVEPLVNSDEKLVDLANIVIKKDFILNKHIDVIEYGVGIIKSLGMNIPTKANKLNIVKEFITYKYHLRGKEYKDILALPKMRDNKKFLISKILFDLIPSAYMTSSDLFGTYSLIMANIALKYGNSKYAPFGYIMSALLIGGGFKQFTTAYELGQIALKVSEQYPDVDCYSRVNFLFGCFVVHGVKPYKEYLPYRELSNKGFIQIGNRLFRNYNDFFTRVQHILFNSATLDKIKNENEDILELYLSSNEEDLIHFQTYILSFINKLQNNNTSQDESQYELYLEKQLNTSIKAMVYTFKALEYYLFEDYDKAFVYIKKALRYIDDQLGVMTDHLFRLIFNLIMLEVKSKNPLFKGVYKLNKFLLKRYAKYSPDNFNLYYYLANAQEFSKKGDIKKANIYFQDALGEAKKGKSLFHIALTNELIGKSWLDIDRNISSLYLENSFKYYSLYKADNKASQLKNRYDLKINSDKTDILSTQDIVTTTSSNIGVNLDVDLVVKASQTISQEIKIENILQKMIHIILENIGANRGFIILEKNNQQLIVASIDDEKVELLSNRDIKDESNISKSIINYVSTTRQIVIVSDASTDEQYIKDSYIQNHKPKSILAIPVIQNDILKGILYCENNLLTDVFSQKIVSTTSMILSQLIISLDNAFVYENLENIVDSRTEELNDEKNFINTIIDSQENFVITSDGKCLKTANKAFYNFYNVKDIDDFMDKFGACICDTFNTTAPKEYIQKTMGDEKWIDYVYSKPHKIHKALINKDDKEYIFTITSEKLKIKGEELKTAIFTDITVMEEAKKQIEATHKHTRDAIEYASLIQGALIPQKGVMEPFFKDHFVMWTPKDTVGGDIWLFNKMRHEDECLLFFIDCTGHGVPGAFVTMIVKSVEREIVSKINKQPELDISPAIIMGYFNKTMKTLLRQETKNSLSNAGWDGGIVYYNRRTQIVKFAGAETPLFYMTKDGEFKTIKGNRYSVGYKKCAMDYKYKETILEVEEGMKFYCTTDGYLDQNGGSKDFPFGKKRFGNIIKEHHKKPMAELQTIFQMEMMEYEGAIENNDRNDDMTVIAFEIGEQSEFQEEIIEEIVKYEGVMTQNVIATCMDNIEVKITNMNVLSTVSTITIEYCQNMMNYSKDEEKFSRQIVPAGEIGVQYHSNEENEHYEIIATNIVAIDDKQKIEPKLIEIQSLDKAGIKKRYRELRKSGQNTHEKGGGIGIYEIAKVSDSIEYEFIKINEDKYSFTMKSFVKPKEKKR
ncbi:MAG: SiaB family protein kinase [Campylobacterota bacterium]|nr:SiaB family protein kinase [Campylobacterota bacterium]